MMEDFPFPCDSSQSERGQHSVPYGLCPGAGTAFSSDHSHFETPKPQEILLPAYFSVTDSSIDQKQWSYANTCRETTRTPQKSCGQTQHVIHILTFQTQGTFPLNSSFPRTLRPKQTLHFPVCFYLLLVSICPFLCQPCSPLSTCQPSGCQGPLCISLQTHPCNSFFTRVSLLQTDRCPLAPSASHLPVPLVCIN